MKPASLWRTGGVIIGGQVVVAALGIVALRLYTELAPARIFGESNLVLGILGLGLQIFVAGFTAALLRYYSEADSQGIGDRFLGETMHWTLRSALLLISLLLAALAIAHLAGQPVYGIDVAFGGAFWIAAMTLRNVLMCRIQAERQQALYVKLQVLEAAAVMLFTIFALRIAPGVLSFLLGQALAALLLIGVICAFDPRSHASFIGRPPAPSGMMQKAIAYGLPFTPLSALSWIANQGDRYTLAWLLGAGAAGRYVAPFSLASRGMSLANVSLCDLFRPVLFDAENRRDTRRARRTFLLWTGASLALSALGLLGILLFGTFAARLLLAREYREGAVEIMMWVSGGYALAGLTQVLENRLLSLGHSARLIVPMIIGALANVAFSILLIPRQGIAGAAQATCASFAVQLGLTGGILWLELRSHPVDGSQCA